MSILSVGSLPWHRPAATAVDPAATTTPVSAGTLAELRTGELATVVGVDASGDPAGARRLFDLGFVPGAEVRMVRRAPLADPVVFRVAGYEIALRREQARWVSVSALPAVAAADA